MYIQKNVLIEGTYENENTIDNYFPRSIDVYLNEHKDEKITLRKFTRDVIRGVIQLEEKYELG